MEALQRRRSPWRGDYPTWETACAKASGYASADILKKVAEATEQVISGKAAYERDSVVFDQIEYSWPVLAGLLRVAARNGSLEVLDFGGSLGSSYRQNMRFLKDLPHHWNIVEQENYVTLGKARFETETLRFHRSIEECLGKGNINAFFSSSTLQYLENPIDFLGELSCFEFPTLILDRVSIIASDQNRLTLQTVPKEIYEASYPCWFFSEKRLFDAIGEKYRLVEKFESFIKNEAWIDGSVHSSDWGYIFELKN
jgi:putative methyltransferase (TIGR04325 family)